MGNQPGSARKYHRCVQPRLEEIRAWAAAGHSLGEMAQALGISPGSLYRYRLRFPQLEQALSGGRHGTAQLPVPVQAAQPQQEQQPQREQQAIDLPVEEMEREVQVEEALFQRASGYMTTVTKHHKVRRVEYDPATGRKVREEDELVEVQDQVHVPGSVPAMRFWLTNRAPHRWQDKPSGEEEGGESGVILLPPVEEDCPEEQGEA